MGLDTGHVASRGENRAPLPLRPGPDAIGNVCRATIITSQVPIEHGMTSSAIPTLADAILDRLVHNAHRPERRKHAQQGEEPVWGAGSGRRGHDADEGDRPDGASGCGIDQLVCVNCIHVI